LRTTEADAERLRQLDQTIQRRLQHYERELLRQPPDDGSENGGDGSDGSSS